MSGGRVSGEEDLVQQVREIEVRRDEGGRTCGTEVILGRPDRRREGHFKEFGVGHGYGGVVLRPVLFLILGSVVLLSCPFNILRL